MLNENTQDKALRKVKTQILPEAGSGSLCQRLLTVWQDLEAGDNCQLSGKL